MIQGWEQLPESGDLLIITKSYKDVMLLYEYNIPAIAPNGEYVIISEEVINSLKKRFKNIFILFDNDLAGVKNSHKYKKAYNDIPIIFLKRKYSKDISDFYKKNKINFELAIEELFYMDLLKNKDYNYYSYFYKF